MTTTTRTQDIYPGLDQTPITAPQWSVQVDLEQEEDISVASSFSKQSQPPATAGDMACIGIKALEGRFEGGVSDVHFHRDELLIDINGDHCLYGSFRTGDGGHHAFQVTLVDESGAGTPTHPDIEF